MKLKFGILSILLSMLLIKMIDAQTNKGKILLGGQTNLSFTSFTSSWKTNYGSGNYNKTKHFQVTPQLGYFIVKNLLGGILIPLTIEKQIVDNNNRKSLTIEFIPLVQKYFGNSKLRPLIYGATGGGWGHDIAYEHLHVPNTTKYKFHTFVWEIGTGTSFSLNERVSLDLKLGFRYHSKSIKSITPVSLNIDQTNIDKGFVSEIGIFVYL